MFHDDTVYKFVKIVCTNNISTQFIKTISYCKKIGFNINALQQTPCLDVNPIKVGNFAFLFNMQAGWSDLRPYGSCFCGQAHRDFSVGFLLLLFSDVCTVESLSLFCLHFISWFYVLGDDTSIS